MTGIERIVAKEFIDAAMYRIRPGPDRRIDHAARATTEFRGVCVGLNLEFLQRLDGWLDYLHVLTSIGTRIRNVIDAVEQKDIVEHAIPIDVDCTLEVQRG